MTISVVKKVANMKKVRLIARLDIKGENLIKGIHLEGLRVIGSPNEFAKKYYRDGADELIFMDSVASLYGRNNLDQIISAAATDIFIPITVGGGIRSVDDAATLLRSGADKIAINTAAVSNPTLITKIAERFGSQAMVLSIEAKRFSDDKWEVYTNCGRERTGLDVCEWVNQGISLGAGEILLTSVDNEGTRKGFDLDLASTVSSISSVPIILSGGMGKLDDIEGAVTIGEVDAVAMADILHYNRCSISSIRQRALDLGCQVRSHVEV